MADLPTSDPAENLRLSREYAKRHYGGRIIDLPLADYPVGWECGRCGTIHGISQDERRDRWESEHTCNAASPLLAERYDLDEVAREFGVDLTDGV